MQSRSRKSSAVAGFQMKGVRDFLPDSIPQRGKLLVKEYNELRLTSFVAELENYLEGRNKQVRRICEKYLMGDCEKELLKEQLTKSECNFLKSVLLLLQSR